MNNCKKSRVAALILSAALVITSVPFFGSGAYAETVPSYDASKAVSYANEHFDDGGTALNPSKEDCVQFVRECFEAGGVPSDTNRIGTDGKPYGYTPDDYISYLVNNGYAESKELKTEKQPWTSPQWYVIMSDNAGVLSAGDGIAHYCPSCGKFFHLTICTGTDKSDFALYSAQNKPVNNKPACTINCSKCGLSKADIKLYSIHMTSKSNDYETIFNDKSVSNLSISRTGTDKLSLVWDEVADASGYRVFIKNGKNSPFKHLADVKAAAYVHTEEKPGADSYFVVRPYFIKNGKTYTGRMSNEVYSKTKLPALELKSSGFNSVKGEVILEWNKVPGAVKYEIYRSNKSEGKYTKVKEITDTFYISEMLLPLTDYYHKVRAIGADGNPVSDFSKPTGIRTGTILEPIPTAVSSGDSVKISWSPVVYADRYEVYRSESKNGSFAKIATLAETELMDKNVVSGRTYYYKVSALNTNKTDCFADSEIISVTFEIEKPEKPEKPENPGDSIFGDEVRYRVFGKNRYETAVKTADELKKVLGVNKFDTIIVASGDNYADALAGSYLAKVKNAPILVVNKFNEAPAMEYIKKNIASGGKVYLLGGNGAVTAGFENSAKKICNVERLGGKDRFETNLNILKEAGVGNEELVICSAWDFADSLSASSVGKPILLTDTHLSAVQKSFIKGLKTDKCYLIGGKGAVSTAVQSEVKAIGKRTERISGANRYDTSVAVAKKFSESKEKDIVLANGDDFPDGLVGGPLAYFMKSPLILINERNTASASGFAKEYASERMVILGGSSLISDETADKIIR